MEYADDGLMRVSNRQEALEMIERHCGGPYRILGVLEAVLTPSAFDEEPSERTYPHTINQTATRPALTPLRPACLRRRAASESRKDLPGLMSS